MTLQEWIQASENLLKQHYCLALSDAGFEPSDLERAWNDGEVPAEYIRRMALKFDLTSKADLGFS